MSAAGRVALVTGAGSGIGAAPARRLAADGHAVALLGRRVEAVAEVAASIEGPTVALECDVRDKAAVRGAVEACAAALGPVDVLVNSAGVSSDATAFELTEEDWDRVIGTNLKGTFLLAQACGRGMVERGWGRVVNLASIFSVVGFKGRIAYGASKGGIAALTRMLAMEWAEHGVTVNAVAPGLIETPMSETRLRDPRYREATLGATPNRRVGQPEDVAAMISYLVGDEAAHVVGQVLFLDGGFTVL